LKAGDNDEQKISARITFGVRRVSFYGGRVSERSDGHGVSDERGPVATVGAAAIGIVWINDERDVDRDNHAIGDISADGWVRGVDDGLVGLLDLQQADIGSAVDLDAVVLQRKLGDWIEFFAAADGSQRFLGTGKFQL
jgi:hypothetical protein